MNKACRISVALLMCFSLLFLTGVNFLVFPQHAVEKKIASTTTDKNDDKDPSAPVEEKSSSTNSISVQEEYLHEKHSADEFLLLETLSHNKILATEKLQVVHFELVSPPPES